MSHDLRLTDARIKAMAKTLRAELGAAAPSYQATLDLLARVLGWQTYEAMKPKLACDDGLDPDALARALAPFARAFEERDELDLEPDSYDDVTAEESPEAARVTIGDFARARDLLEGTDHLVPPAKLPDAPKFTIMAHPDSRAPTRVSAVTCQGLDFDLLQDADLRTGEDPEMVASYRFLDGQSGQPLVRAHRRDEVPFDDHVPLKAEGLRTRRQRTAVRQDLSHARSRLEIEKEAPLVAFVSGGIGFAAAERDLEALRRGRPGVRIVALTRRFDGAPGLDDDKLAALRLLQDVL